MTLFRAISNRTAIVLLMVTSCSTIAVADLVDSFDYTDTASFTNTWVKTGSRDFNITSGSLSYGNLATSGNKLTIDAAASASGSTYTRSMDSIDFSDAGDTVYMSALVHVRNTGGGDGTLKLALPNTWSTLASIETLDDDNASVKGYAGTSTPGVTVDDGTHFIVAKFFRGGASGTDNRFSQVSLWIDPDVTSLGGSEDGTADAVSSHQFINDFSCSFDSAQLNLGGYFPASSQDTNAAADADIDELRVGTTWADVTPTAAAIPEPGSMALLLSGLLAMWTARKKII